MQTMVETKTEKAISAIAGIAAAVAVKSGPFEEEWISQVCKALRDSVDKLEIDLMEQHKRKQPFRLNEAQPRTSNEGSVE